MGTIKELLQISDEEVKAIRKFYGKTEDDVNEDVDLLLNWLEKQPHLPQLHDVWNEELKLQKDFFESLCKKCADETLRTGKPIQNDLFSIAGTFKKINLD